jgi:hypothetical protein
VPDAVFHDRGSWRAYVLGIYHDHENDARTPRSNLRVDHLRALKRANYVPHLLR